MIKIDKDMIHERINDSPRGGDAVFVRLNDKVGIKLYYDKSTRDRAYKYQTKAAKYDLGPETYGKVDGFSFIKTTENLWSDIKIEEEFRFGYLTEIVETIENRTQWNFYAKKIDDLRTNLMDCIGFSFTDNHDFNCGLKDGMLVCIDFGEIQ